MDHQKHQMNRRTLLKGLAAIPVVAAVGFHGTASAEMLSADDPTAKALAYTPNSTTDGQHCSNCNLYGGGAESGTCTIFQGKQVAANGWCKSWIAKA